MSNSISRKEAIDALENIFDRCEEINLHLQDGDPDKDDYKMYPDYLTVWKYLNQDKDHNVDTVPVVRCGDCKHWIPYDWMFSEVRRSQRMSDYPDNEIGCEYADMSMSASDFCSRGERREESDDT